MKQLVRVGTTYIPVSDVQKASTWYREMLNAKLNYKDEDKAILDLANQSIFLVCSADGESSNFLDKYHTKRFSLTFEVDGSSELKELREQMLHLGVEAGEIEDRGHGGLNFVFSDPDGNLFDVWSELSPKFKQSLLTSEL
ncbi:VOC family protein [Rossellomorea arthrocnemi]|jgi:catechol 2,3-dioxygenase-like lactoylglutathione lyase family enzyme|uniref:VOC family protein n=1 Tax=Rossellomorea arthrocnemi TaxID=2769542 RepID=UPI00191B2024|nr:VOC family protein [Rossellomorea arthrocnemi]